MNASSVFASRNREILRSNIMRIIDISHRKIDSEQTSHSAGVQCTCCQGAINSTYPQQSSDIVTLASQGARDRASHAKRFGVRKLDHNRIPIADNNDAAHQP